MVLNYFLVKAGRLVTAHESLGTINDGALIIHDGKIEDIGDYCLIKQKYNNLPTLDYTGYVITPSLVDCHTHVLEYAPPSVYNVTGSAHLMAGTALLLKAVTSGVTSLGEQSCGQPNSDLAKRDYLEATRNFPMDIVFSVSSISVGLPTIVHFSGVTGSKAISSDMLLDDDILDKIIDQSDYPGENIFINATPANLVESLVPKAGEIIYTQEQLDRIVNKFH